MRTAVDFDIQETNLYTCSMWCKPQRERKREKSKYKILQKAEHQKQQSERLRGVCLFQVWQQQDDWLAEIEGKSDR